MEPTTVLTIAAVCLLFANLNAFLLMRIDKRHAQKREHRIPEHTLFWATACFGGLGGLLAMYVYRHKTQHWQFRIGFPLLLAIQVALLIWGLTALLG